MASIHSGEDKNAITIDRNSYIFFLFHTGLRKGEINLDGTGLAAMDDVRR